ncbi:MAG: hypothetical protein HC899_39255 [Leptolyngbyaceae cyanobacterium SM1_4_3]|nr:hypothetical protein [Leptolyngbyaceae cyanobacterium SM1_4_3]
MPAIAIRRTGITQSSEDMGSMGINQTTGVLTIKRRLQKELDSNYQNLLNKLMLENLNPGGVSSLRTQGSNNSIIDPATREGSYLFDPRLGNNVWEIFTIPQPQFYTASYQVIFWTVQHHQINDMMQTFLSSQLPQGKMFRLNTESGYWFIAHVDEEASSEENYEEFTEEKRLVRYSFRLRVKAFLLAFNGPGVPVPVRRSISATEISFGLSTAPGLVLSEQEEKRIPLEPKDSYLLSELGEASNTAQAKTITQKLSVEEQVVDSVTGEVKTRRVKVLDTNQKSGETVYYSNNVRNLEELAETLGYKPI